MQHGEAIRGMTSEKYLLNELTPELREEFEEHFFGCTDCALEVKAGATFLEHSKIVLAAPTQSKAPAVAPARQTGGWQAWLRPAVAVPVMALLLVVIGYQNFVTFSKLERTTAELQAPRILPSATLVSARSDRVPVVAARPNETFLLFVDVPTESRFTSYVCELYSPAGTLEWSIPVSADAAKDALPLRVPSGQAAPGAYSLVVRGVLPGQNSSVVARYPFELQVQK